MSKEKDLSTGKAKQSPEERNDRDQKRPTEVCRFDLKFRITLDNYIKYNMLLTHDMVQRAKKRNRILGIFEIIAGVIFLVLSFIQENLQGEWLFAGISAIIIVVGVISLIYYPIIFPKQIHKAGSKHYMKNRYLQSEIHIQMSDSFFREIAVGNQTDIFWADIKEIKESDTMYLIVLDEKRCIIIPKKAFDEESLQKFRVFLADVLKRYDKKKVDIGLS